MRNAINAWIIGQTRSYTSGRLCNTRQLYRLDVGSSTAAQSASVSARPRTHDGRDAAAIEVRGSAMSHCRMRPLSSVMTTSRQMSAAAIQMLVQNIATLTSHSPPCTSMYRRSLPRKRQLIYTHSCNCAYLLASWERRISNTAGINYVILDVSVVYN